MKKILTLIGLTLCLGCSSIEDFIDLQESKEAGRTATSTIESNTKALCNIADIAFHLNKYIQNPTEDYKNLYFPGYSLVESSENIWTLSNDVTNFVIKTSGQNLEEINSQWSIQNERNEVLNLKHKTDGEWSFSADEFRLNNGWTCLALDIVICEIKFVKEVIDRATMSGDGSYKDDNGVRYAFTVATGITIAALKFIGGVLELVIDDQTLDDIDNSLTAIIEENRSLQITIDGKTYNIGF